MTNSDIQKIQSTLQTSFDDFWSSSILKLEIANPRSTILAAKERDSIVGFGGSWESPDAIHITNIVVRKDKRKLGIGSNILEKLIETGKDKDKEFTLEVNVNNTSAIRLYEKYHFEKVGTRKKYYNNTEDATIMTRRNK